MRKSEAKRVIRETKRQLANARVEACGPQSGCEEATEAVRRTERLIRGARWGLALALAVLDSENGEYDTDALVLALADFLRWELHDHEGVNVEVIDR